MAFNNAAYPNGLDSPYSGVVAVNISEANHEFDPPLRGIYVGGTGDLVIVAVDGSTAELEAIPVGTLLNIGIRTVVKTNTTTTKMIGLL